jgi:hypothetical protein
MSSLDEPDELGPLVAANPSVPVFGDLSTANLPVRLTDQLPYLEEDNTADPTQHNSNLDTVGNTESSIIEDDILATAGSNSFLTTVRKSWNIGELDGYHKIYLLILSSLLVRA